MKLKMMKYIIFICVIIFSFEKGNTQIINFDFYGKKDTNMSYDSYLEVIREAVITQPDFKQLLARKTAYNFDLRAERAERFPSISSSIRNDRMLDRKIDDFQSLRKRQDDSTDFIVELSQPLYSGGIVNKRIDNARKQKAIGDLELKKQGSELVIRANTIFLDLIRYSIYKKNIESGIMEIKSILNNTNNRIQAGSSTITERALIQIRLNQLLISEAEVNAQLLRSKETFARFFNKDFSNFFYPKLELKEFSNSSNSNKNNISDESLKSYDLIISEISYAQQKNQLAIERAAYKPKIGLSLKYVQYDFDDDFEENDIRGGFTFSMPIFDFGRTRNKVKSSMAQVEQFKWAVNADKRDFLITKSEVENRILSMIQSLKDLKSTVENTREQKKILLNRMGLSEFNGVNLSEIIIQDISNTQQLLDTELQLYMDDLQLSHIERNLLNRFRLKI